MDISSILYSIAIIFCTYIVILIIANILKHKIGMIYNLRKYIYIFIITFGVNIVLRFNSEIENYLGKYGNIVNALLNIVIAFALIKMVDIVFNDLNIMKRKSEKLSKLVRSLFVFGCTGLILLIILKVNLGVNLTTIVTTSAVLSMVIGLALQDTLTNLIAGIVLHSEKSFKIGDFVKVNEVEGRVFEVSWRTTKIVTFDNAVVYIPNSLMVKQVTANYSEYDTHLAKITVGASYKDSPNKVTKILMEIAEKENEVVNNPKPEVRVLQMGDFSINYELRVWVRAYDRRKPVETEILKKIWYSFGRNGIKIPFPIREIHNIEESCYDWNKEKEILIRKIELFKEFENEEIKALVPLTKSKIYGINEKIFTEGDEGDSFSVIYNGKVNIIMNKEKIAELKRGDFFGEMSLLTGKKRSATAVAVEETELLVIDKAGFSEFIMNNEHLIHKISESISIREYENERRNSKNSAEDKEKNILMIKNKQNKLIAKIKTFFEI
jgi:small-conductance mechanosensitive channel